MLESVPGGGDQTSRVARRFIVTGKVQGVYFRHSTRVEAQRLGIAGVARNLADGSVEVVAIGPGAALEQLHQWLHRGPPQAQVSAVSEVDSSDKHTERLTVGKFSVE